MLQNIKKATFYLIAAYWIVTLLGILLTILFAAVFNPPSPEELGVTASQSPAYLMTIPYHWLLNLLVWPPFAWLYLRGFPTEESRNEAFRLGAFWAITTIIVDLIGWVLVPHPWAMTLKEMYVDYQPWISLIYIIIFVSPVGIFYMLNRQELKKENEMNTKTEGALALIAALIVLFSAMWNPLVSVAVSMVALMGFGIYKFVHQSK